MRHDDRLRELRSLYLKHIKIFFIKKSDRRERSRTAQIQEALEKTALCDPDIDKLLEENQKDLSTFSGTSAS
ncbi:MAG: hypothetical protein CMF55_06065 [Legionellales bacterium]|nr:hypothetical protein [Legionellales bacterium]